MSEGLQYAARKQSDKAYAAGYDKGKSNAVKQQRNNPATIEHDRVVKPCDGNH